MAQLPAILGQVGAGGAVDGRRIEQAENETMESPARTEDTLNIFNSLRRVREPHVFH
ncbi:MAG: hypothetical protein ACRD9W_26005 [Terriglobia bacterium]